MENNKYIQEDVLSSKERNNLNDNDFGLPETRQFPLNDEEHIKLAMKMFKHCPKNKRNILARNIERKCKQYQINITNPLILNALNYKSDIQEMCTIGAIPVVDNLHSPFIGKQDVTNKRNLSDLEERLDELTIQESFLFSHDNLYINFDKFENGQNNICFITGLSGSGKSTISHSIASKYHAEIIELDIFEYCSGFNDKQLKQASIVLYEYLNNHRDLWEKLKKKEIKGKDLTVEIKKFILYAISYCKKNKDKKWILEGVQIYSFLEPEKYKSYPIIFVNASMIKSITQRWKRNGNGKIEWRKELKNEFPQMLSWYIDNEKSFNSFKKAILTEDNKLNEDIFLNELILNEDFEFLKNIQITEYSEDYFQELKEENGNVICNKYRERIYNGENLKIIEQEILNDIDFIENNPLATEEDILNISQRLKLVLLDIERKKKEAYSKHFNIFELQNFNDDNIFKKELNESSMLFTEGIDLKEELHPVFVLLSKTYSPLAVAIRKFTKEPFSHSSISFDSSLRCLFSFGQAEKNGRLGFIKEDIKNGVFGEKSHEIEYSLYVTFVSTNQFLTMQEFLQQFVDKSKQLKYTFRGLINYALGKESHFEDKYFCSQFVAELIKIGGIKLKKDPSLYSPYQLRKINNMFYVSRGLLANYKESKTILRLKEIENKFLLKNNIKNESILTKEFLEIKSKELNITDENLEERINEIKEKNNDL